MRTMREIVGDWVDRNPQRPGESMNDWRQRGLVETQAEREALRKMEIYDRRVWLTMLARGIIAAYILGILTSFGGLDPRGWGAFAWACAGSFLIAWVVAMGMDEQ